jgi:hypothetical protein
VDSRVAVPAKGQHFFANILRLQMCVVPLVQRTPKPTSLRDTNIRA